MEPRRFKISEKTSAYVGFPDARVEIGVTIPLYGEYRLKIVAEEFEDVEQIFVYAKAFQAELERIKREKAQAGKK